eukprot:3763379-Rhodomonas_salina.1
MTCTTAPARCRPGGRPAADCRKRRVRSGGLLRGRLRQRALLHARERGTQEGVVQGVQGHTGGPGAAGEGDGRAAPRLGDAVDGFV